jgi:hypothetical protein
MTWEIFIMRAVKKNRKSDRKICKKRGQSLGKPAKHEAPPSRKDGPREFI